MVVQFVQWLALGVCLLAVIVCAARLVRRLQPALGPDLFHATFLIACAFVIYTAGILLGTVGRFDHLGLLIGSVVAIACWRGTIRFGWNECRTLLGDFGAGLSAQPVLLALVAIPLLLHMMAPVQCGDSLSYHLPNSVYFVKTATTVTHQADMMFAPGAASSYYTRGMELIYAFWYQFPGHRLSILAFKAILFLAFYFMLKAATDDSRLAATLFVLVWSLDIVQHDVGSLKNDLVLALVVVYATVLLTDDRWRLVYHLPLAMALTLLLAIKGNGLLYATVLLGLWSYRERRHLPRIALLTLGIIVPLGLYFYGVNLLQKGSPLYPFGVRVFGMELFPGAPGVLETSIVANLDRALPMLFLRGLVRRMGPVLPVLCGVGLVLALGGMLKRRSTGRAGRVPGMAWLFLVLWLIAYGVTPLSDRNGPIRHNLLYGGQTIRLALPAVLWAVVMLARAAAGWLAGGERRARWWFWGVVIASVINLIWFDLLALVVKPESAFAAQAAALGTFDNRILLAFTMLIWVVALLGTWRRRGIVLTTLVVLCVLLYYGGYPTNLSHTSRFKRVGQTTEVFRFLDRHDLARCRVVLHSTAGSFFLSIMNGYLLDSADHVKLIDDVSTAETADLLVVCAGNQWEHEDIVRGMQYRQSLSFWTATSLPEGFRRVYADAFYLVYLNEHSVIDGERWTSSSATD